MVERDLQQFSSLSPASIVARCGGLIDAAIDNEIVALHIANGTCYGLNAVGSRIWRLLDAPIQIRDICSKLLTEYEVEPSTCERQVLDLLEELRAEGLIATHEQA